MAFKLVKQMTQKLNCSDICSLKLTLVVHKQDLMLKRRSTRFEQTDLRPSNLHPVASQLPTRGTKRINLHSPLKASPGYWIYGWLHCNAEH